ncbi:ASCH domain-containing protein [Chryseobacterium sp. MDT2-18]|uniref:ASCH domain-containing protein n=1 Tax=Chryseobacterium sp. MDT2-18 TaxID=1259136 RepID=UPI002781BC46|nr:ASCH domain-containing protein [Chryseobacterium sp. MDT2-18]MDQ0477098.1 putative transcriptional regulator [Chryseobacterium sp. MDT2-18]
MKNTLIDAILSIKPIYAEAIINGTKTVEFRKKVFKKDVERIFIYSSSPTKMIIGYFTFKNIVEDTPKNLWKQFHKIGGINEQDFFKYYKEAEKGFCMIIDKVVKLENEIDPIDFIENFKAPQSYIYLENKKIRQLT